MSKAMEKDLLAYIVIIDVAGLVRGDVNRLAVYVLLEPLTSFISMRAFLN